MTSKKPGPGLGKKNGLGVLLSNTSVNITQPAGESVTPTTKLNQLPIEKIVRGKYQPRKHMDSAALQELAESIKAQGIIQPIVVRLLDSGDYEIIAGERRWRAAQLAGLDKVPVVIKEVPDEAAIAMALIENIQREDLNPIEEAVALQRLLDEFGLTHQQAAEAVGKSRTTVTNFLRLLTLNEDVKALLAQGKLEMGHAKVLLALTGSRQSQVAKLVALKGLTVRETEQLVKASLDPTPTVSKKPVDPDIRRLENELSDKLAAKTKLHHQPNGKGKLVIQYNSLDELEGILDHIN